MDFVGKVVIVTGAAKGMGFGAAVKFANEGASVGLVDNDAATLATVEKNFLTSGKKVKAFPTDVSNAKDVQKMVDGVIAEFGALDVIANCAGIQTYGDAVETTEEVWDKTLDVNVKSMFLTAKYGVPHMRKRGGGAIVNISSILGIKPQGLPQAAYASSKAGLIGLTRDLAAQWTGRKNIRVNALAPGFFPSEMSDELPKDMVEMVKNFTPAGRLGDPEELAATLIWLVSDASSYVTGITVPVDGGLVMP